MKLIQLKNFVVNLDKVIYVDVNHNTIYMQDDHKIVLDEELLNIFITNYNRINSNEFENAVRTLTEALAKNPYLMTRSQLQEQLVIMTRNYQLENLLKEASEGKKISELSITKLLEVHRIILDEAQQIEIRNEVPF